jgi:long-chain acyl-CoA synthetase
MAEVATPWLDSYPPGVPEHVEVPAGNLARLLDDAARDFPSAPALHFQGRTVSYAQLAEQAWRFAGALAGLGVGKGTKVGLVLPNCPQVVIAFFGALRLGAVVVQNNPLYTERELGHQLGDAGTEVVICLDLAYERIKPIREQGAIREVVVTSLLDELPAVRRVIAPYTRRGKAAAAAIGKDEPVRRWRDLMAAAITRAGEAEVDPAADLALLQYTGGTTGSSKGVMLSHRNLRANTEQVRAWFPDADPGREVMMAVLPFFHVYGLTVCLLLGVRLGAALVLLPRFDLDQVMAAVDRHRPTLFPGVPTMYVAINNEVAKGGGHDLSSIKACLSGAAPLPLEVAERFERYSGGRLVEGYGLSECSPVALANPIYGKRKAGTIGMPLPDTLARVVDAADPDSIPPAGEPGELAIKGPQVMRGYWNRPEESAQVLRDGWLLTGDLALTDDEGYFQIVDRKKDLIIAGGFNVYPREVEEVLYEHPKVEEVSVVGVPDSYLGEVVKAFVVLRPGEEATTEEIRSFAKERLAAYKVPRMVEFRDELPKTLIGKVLRRALVEEERAKAEAKAGAAEPE